MSAALVDFISQTAADNQWMTDAACTGRWADFDAPDTGGRHSRSDRVRNAAATCHTCPVMEACHQSARQPTIYGVSGLGVRAGVLYAKHQGGSIIPVALPTADHGTVGGAANHHAMREKPCGPCGEVVAEIAAPVPVLPYPREPAAHGTADAIVAHRKNDEDLCGRCQDAETVRLESARPNNLRKYHARQQRLRELAAAGLPARKSRAKTRQEEVAA